MKGNAMTETKLVSPNQILQAAKDYMLDGMEPEDYDDWILIVNFIAFNVPSDLAESICLIMKTLFDIPVSDGIIALIAAYQKVSKENGESFDRHNLENGNGSHSR